jgi:hypothetical protein
VVLAQAETAHLLSAQTIDARVQSARRSLFAFRDPEMMGVSDKLDLLTRMPESHFGKQLLAAFTTRSAVCLQTSRDQLHSNGLQPHVLSFWPAISWESTEIGGRVTLGDLTAVLNAATAAPNFHYTLGAVAKNRKKQQWKSNWDAARNIWLQIGVDNDVISEHALKRRTLNHRVRK